MFFSESQLAQESWMKFKCPKAYLGWKALMEIWWFRAVEWLAWIKEKDMLEFYFSRSSSSSFDYPVPKFNMKYG